MSSEPYGEPLVTISGITNLHNVISEANMKRTSIYTSDLYTLISGLL